MGRSRKPGPGARGWLDGFDEAAAECERVVLGVGDGELRIVDVRPVSVRGRSPGWCARSRWARSAAR
ncbi:hypothetical protein H0E86_30710 [Streptomyces sp. SCSIO-PteL053]|nr:hypothetical protein H0E86_30710 [Streptomyces sp. SCSIO-PteL053]